MSALPLVIRLPGRVNADSSAMHGLRDSSIADIDSTRLDRVDKWWTTAMEIAKSKEEGGWGNDRVSAMTETWGWWWEAILARLDELYAWSVAPCPGYRKYLPVRAYDEEVGVNH